jgi:hypothetical protein
MRTIAIIGVVAVLGTVFLIIFTTVDGERPGQGFSCNRDGYVVPEGKFKHVSISSSSACAIRETGELVCWEYKVARTVCR